MANKSVMKSDKSNRTEGNFFILKRKRSLSKGFVFFSGYEINVTHSLTQFPKIFVFFFSLHWENKIELKLFSQSQNHGVLFFPRNVSQNQKVLLFFSMTKKFHFFFFRPKKWKSFFFQSKKIFMSVCFAVTKQFVSFFSGAQKKFICFFSCDKKNAAGCPRKKLQNGYFTFSSQKKIKNFILTS